MHLTLSTLKWNEATAN